MTKLPKLGNVNAAAVATIFKDGKAVAQCADTPNAIAYAFNKTSGDVAKSFLETTYPHSMGDRVKNAGWLDTDEQAIFKLL